MPTFKYRYAGAPLPMPSVLLNLSRPDGGSSVANLAAIVDTGADQTVLPTARITELGVLELGRERVLAYDGTPQVLPTHLVRLQVRDFEPMNIVVIASDLVPDAVLGRDVLNRYRIVLDGPRQLLEISDDST